MCSPSFRPCALPWSEWKRKCSRIILTIGVIVAAVFTISKLILDDRKAKKDDEPEPWRLPGP